MQEHAELAADFLPDTQWKCHRPGGVVTPRRLEELLATTLSTVEGPDTGRGQGRVACLLAGVV